MSREDDIKHLLGIANDQKETDRKRSVAKLVAAASQMRKPKTKGWSSSQGWIPANQ